MIDLQNLTDDQKEIVKEYQTIYNRISVLEDQIKTLSAEASKLIEQLNIVRQKDKKIFESYGKEK